MVAEKGKKGGRKGCDGEKEGGLWWLKMIVANTSSRGDSGFNGSWREGRRSDGTDGGGETGRQKEGEGVVGRGSASGGSRLGRLPG
ncbi:hypothetical protein Acr_28g0001750 [Actinidia rufa]|uniref:Uncharacterized protein n=1 Tax=Actinidia rufa TaxID=165716 RepID=A0A7J0H8N6_9ERIC|nr:hypothetical protein Acr_28g0001750 [Actinidia rufa]